jgi:hypothetical protein
VSVPHQSLFLSKCTCKAVVQSLSISILISSIFLLSLF